MADVFVSYKAEDRKRVKPLVEALQAEGFSVWWDEQIGGGAAWRSAIEAELNAAKCVIVVWSNRSVGPEGTFVQDEATRAQQRHIYVPVLIDKVHMPLGFGETQALPLVGWHGKRDDPRYQAVLAAVRRNVGGKRRSTAIAPAFEPRVSRRSVIAGGAVAAAAVAGVGAWALLKPKSAGAASDSIAVLPFENLSGDPAQAYFSDGIAEEIRSALARLGGLTVIGRTSSEAVRNDDAPTAAKKLGVANILTGSVRQSPSTMRITAELVDGRTGADRWSQDYDRPPGDSIKIQSDIAGNVANALNAALGRAARAAITVGGTSNPAAQKLVLQANQLARIPGESEGRTASDLFQAAIQLDPNYADAYARKAGVVLWLTDAFGHDVPEVMAGRVEAQRLARQALQIAPQLPFAHLALAWSYQSNLELRPALGELTRAKSLAPGDSIILMAYAVYLANIGDFATAGTLGSQALALDPLDPSAYGAQVRILFLARRYRGAVDLARRAPPNVFDSPGALSQCLMMLGRLDEARQTLNHETADEPERLANEALLAARKNDRAGALLHLNELRQRTGAASSYQYSEIYAQLGDRDPAIGALEQAMQLKDAGMFHMRVDPLLDPIRSDPRFAALVHKMNFPAA